MLNAVKDVMTAKAAQLYLNTQLARYGRVSDLKIDSRNKTVELTCHLIGEPEPVSIRILRYEIQETGGRHLIAIKELACSRPWLQNLVEDFCLARPVVLPPWAAGAL